MENKIRTFSHINDRKVNEENSPGKFAEDLALQYSISANNSEKKKKGQFFTPLEIARFMANLAESVSEESVSILDPGCGTAILSITLIESIVKQNSRIKKIELVCYESDIDIKPFLEQSLKYINEYLTFRGIEFIFEINTADFIEINKDTLLQENLFFRDIKTFDYIISNPPYFKLKIGDIRSEITSKLFNGKANIYTIFMAISANLLNAKGQLIFIIPRSFSSGQYFNSFRKYFFSRISLTHIHLFDSRKEAFDKDGILQETIIIRGSSAEKDYTVPFIEISSSNGKSDIENAKKLKIPKDEILDDNTTEKILYIPVNFLEKEIIDLFNSWDNTLNSLNIQISTGPVVAFRYKEALKEVSYDGNTVPLFWLHNVSSMLFTWPIKKPNKMQYISKEEIGNNILVANKNYIFLRRFSSKDDKKRLIAAPYFSNIIYTSYIGIENKLNYIYRPKGYLDRAEIVGISALLNSSLYDRFFRIMNGNVNVSATELRMMHFPKPEVIKDLGRTIILNNNFDIRYIDGLINKKLGFDKILERYEI